MAHNLQERYSQLTDVKLRASLVTKDHVVFNTRYDGNPVAGAVKVPVRDAEVTVEDYSKTGGTNLTHGSTIYLNIPISNDKAVNELIDGYDAAGVPDNLVADRIDSAGYSLGLTLDTAGVALLAGADTAVYATTDPRYGKKATAHTLGADESIFDACVDARASMTKVYVPATGRYVLASPDFYSKILKDKDNFVKKGDLSQKLVETGAVGEIAGFAVYETPNLPAGVLAVFGHPDYATRIDEYKVPVHVQDLSGSGKYIGACAVQGRMVYEHCVTKPQAFYILKTAKDSSGESQSTGNQE